jgi:predicted kinase
MTQILLTRGLPASGKSTYAEQWLAEDPAHRARVNRDLLRFELYGQWYPEADERGTVKEKEDHVTQVEHQRIEKALREGKDVIVDNTNLNPMVFNSYGKIAKRMGAELNHKDFPVDIEECIRRNNARDRVVPEHVIRRMQQQYMGPNGEFHLFPGDYPLKPFVAPSEKRQAFIFDMDGTLANIEGIRHFVAGKYRNFDGFHRSSVWSPANVQVAELAKQAHLQGYSIVITTARNETYRAVTQKWLDDNNIPYENIYMRADGDFRKDHIVKKEILKNILQHYDVVHAVDDRDEVIDVWRSAGIGTTRVPGLRPGEENVGVNVAITNPFTSGKCLRCGKPISSGTFGPRCARLR